MNQEPMQVVVFVRGGVVQAVATWPPREEVWRPCVVVDYDDGLDIGLGADAYIKDQLGYTREEFDALATYIY